MYRDIAYTDVLRRPIDSLVKRATSVLLARSYQLQRRHRLRDLDLWGLNINGRSRLAAGNVDLVDLLARYGSPLLIVHRQQLQRDATEVIRAFQVFPEGSRILYSYKTNCIPGVARMLHECGIGAEVISPYELWLAERLRVPGDSIVYNGVDKSEESLRRAAALGALAVNIDHREELEVLRRLVSSGGNPLRVGVRLALNRKSQFGLNVEDGEAMAVCEQLARLRPGIELHCIHFNVASNVKTSHTHVRSALRALGFIKALKQQLGVSIRYLDIGGGMGVPTTKNMTGSEYGLYRAFGILPAPPDPKEAQPISEFFRDINDAAVGYCRQEGMDVPKILIEPGRLLTSRAEFLLTAIHSIKERPPDAPFAITDVGRLSVTFPCEFEYHEMFLANRPLAEPEVPYNIVGRICTSADWLARNRLLPRLTPADTIAIMDAGAYFSSNASNFAFPRPRIVSISEGEARIIRDEESFEHLTAMDEAWHAEA